MNATQQTPEAFFFEHAGYSYDPATETQEQGRQNTARRLAECEEAARLAGMRFDWAHDDETDESFRDTDAPYRLWVCVAWLPSAGGSYTLAGSLGGIDLGPDHSPAQDPYSRVVEAELAAEYLPVPD